MNRRLTVFLAVIVCALLAGMPLATAFAQTFTLTEIKTTGSATPGQEVDLYADVINQTPGDLQIRVQKTKNDLPADWYSSFCLVNCYSPDATDVIETLPPGETGHFKLAFETSGTPGEGTVEFVLTSVINPTDTYKMVFHASTSLAAVDKTPLPKVLALTQNYPNPFSISEAGSVMISFAVPKTGFTSLKVYNLVGREVRTLVSEPTQAGTHSVTWDARDNTGNIVPAGVYIYKIAGPNGTLTRRMVVTH